MEVGIQGILSDIWNLSSLVELSLNNCNLKEERSSILFCSIPAGITRLSNLKALNLSRCKKLQEIPELPSSLRRLKLSHCKKLQAIPELPSSLQLLDMHCTDGISSLSIHSLEPQISLGPSDFGRSIFIPRSSGILEGTKNQSMGSNEVRIELPQNWYENNEFLGFALCYCVPVTSEFELYCMLAIGANYQSKVVDTLLIKYQCDCPDDDDDGSISDLVWVTYYPKNAIRSNITPINGHTLWLHLKAPSPLKRKKISSEPGEFAMFRASGSCRFRFDRVLGALNRSINHFSSIIPISIIQLSKLRVLDLSHCQKLLQIPELPPSLRILDVHACPYLETLSSPSSLLANRKRSSNNNRASMDWYQNNDFLGFALYSVYVPLHIESKEVSCSSKCKLNFHGLDDLPSTFRSMDGLSSKFWPIGGLSFRSSHSCHHNGDELNGVWVAYYPKVAIPNQYKSNKWRHLKASFRGYLGGKQVKVKECGFHLIYMPRLHQARSYTDIDTVPRCSKMLWHQISSRRY
ncbi:hypothetical protein AAG906_013261 [Vitis piasezkii]